MKQEEYLEICPNFNMVRYYFAKSLQGSQFCCYHNIIIGIHEDYIPSYDASRKVFLEELKVKLEREK